MFVIFMIVIVGLLYYVYDCHRVKKLPPYIRGGLPIIGHSIQLLTTKNLFNFITSHLDYLLERKNELQTIRLGIWDLHFTLNPEDAYMIANSHLEKDKIYSFVNSFFGEGLITAPVATWKVHRKLLNPTVNQQVLDGYLHEFNCQATHLMDNLADKAGKGPFDHYIVATQTSLEIICSTAMGTSNSEEEKQTRKIFVETLQCFLIAANERILRFWLHNDFIYNLTGRRKQMDVLADQMKVLSKKIFETKKAEFELNRSQSNDSKSKKCFKPFIEHLLELAEDGFLTDRETADELNTFIAAGTDTMATTLSNVLTCIGSYSAVQDRILEELQGVFEGSDRDAVKQDLSKLNYLEAVIKETLRMYPPVPIIGRFVDKEIKIRGYTLPADSRCFIAVYGLQRHWSWGPDAHQFRPERWLDGSLPDNMKLFAAFGVGKRNCIGYNFALMGLKTILARFLRRYSIKSDVTKMVQEFNFTAKPISGHEIAIEKRYKHQEPGDQSECYKVPEKRVRHEVVTA